jgi:hypothetical protein
MHRRPQLTEEQAIRAMRELGIGPSDFLAIERAPSYSAKRECLKVLQDKAKAGFKKAALRLHPDIPENRTEEKGELFRLVRQAIDEIGRLRIRPPRPRPIFHSVPIVFSTGFTSTASTATTASTSGGGFITIRFR